MQVHSSGAIHRNYQIFICRLQLKLLCVYLEYHKSSCTPPRTPTYFGFLKLSSNRGYHFVSVPLFRPYRLGLKIIGINCPPKLCFNQIPWNPLWMGFVVQYKTGAIYLRKHIESQFIYEVQLRLLFLQWESIMYINESKQSINISF